MSLTAFSNLGARVLKQRAVLVTLLFIVAAVLVVFSGAVPELCQHKEKQWSGMVWGQHLWAEPPTYKTCLDRIW